MNINGLTLIAGLLVTTPAMAREFCPERPGQTTPPCTVARGEALTEVGLIDWSLEQNPDSRTDTVTLGQTALRVGIADHAEVAVAWTPLATQRLRDKVNGAVIRQSGVGDVTVAVKRSFGDADDPKVALKAFVTLPVGTEPAGGGDWSAGVLLPVALPVTKGIEFTLTPEIDAVTDQNGDGHHIAYGSAGGLEFKLSDAVSLSGDAKVMRDDDPAGATTTAAAGTSIAFQPGKRVQFDMGGNFGLNNDTPDVEFYVGVAVGF